MKPVTIPFDFYKQALEIVRNGAPIRIPFDGFKQRDLVIKDANEEGQRRGVTPEIKQVGTFNLDVIYRSACGRKPSALRVKITEMELNDKITIEEPITQTIRSTITNVAKSYLPKRTFRLKGQILTRIQ